MKKEDLQTTEYNQFYSSYVNMVNDDLTLLQALESGKESSLAFFSAISSEKLLYAYAKGKWTILQVLLHLIDTERIFQYRALCIARNDKTSFPGFDQDNYIEPSRANNRGLLSLLEEYLSVRHSTLQLFKNLPEDSLTRLGEASNNLLSPRAAGFIIAGHELHHIKIVRERYFD